ncbi:MAG: hypothetical protein K0Q49_1418 [Haloplasmataceae bacterium]|jgi:hypothetical protein|nr:hypothetical protein [Haloplasmataceae bacterium]
MKKKANFIKIYIKNEDHKLNFPPIPFFMTTTIISIAKRIYLLTKKKQNNDIDVQEVLNDLVKILKELKNYPPFELVTVESENTLIIIKTK